MSDARTKESDRPARMGEVVRAGGGARHAIDSGARDLAAEVATITEATVDFAFNAAATRCKLHERPDAPSQLPAPAAAAGFATPRPEERPR